jgi:hypothetical protein
MDNYKDDYRKLITEMVNKIEDERFLRQIYTLIVMHNRRAGD